MLVIIFWEGFEDPIPLEIPDDSDSDLLIQLLLAETGRSFQQCYLEYEGRRIGIGQDLAAVGITDGASLIVKKSAAATTKAAPTATSSSSSATTSNPVPFAAAAPLPASSNEAGTAPVATTASHGPTIYDIPADIKPEELLSLAKSNTSLLAQFQSHDPDLGILLSSGDLTKLRGLMMKRFMERHKQTYQKQQELLSFERDPMNPELQKKIEEQIQLENIQANMEAAIENLPEAFGRVTMLYVNIEVNGHPVKAFVDSGAQSTIMSAACAERCNVTRLIDKRFAGFAKGVGTARILGRIHIAQMKFGSSYFPISITILENNDVDFLFGLDTLRRYRCCIDLEKNVLRIDGVKGIEEIGFLPESELPVNARGNYAGDGEDAVAASGSAGGSAPAPGKG